MDRLQLSEKPLTFIFTYLERHWIDHQINEQRSDILPMKQLIWSIWNQLVLKKIWSSVLAIIGDYLHSVRIKIVELDELCGVAKFVHYLRVISKPNQLESDFKSTKRGMMAGAVVNPRAIHVDKFSEFVQWYCDKIQIDSPKLVNSDNEIREYIQSV